MKKMIQCKTCNAEIARNAKICPKCGAKNKNKKGLIIIGSLIAIFILIGSSGEDTPDNNNLSEIPPVENVTEEVLATTAASEDTTSIPLEEDLSNTDDSNLESVGISPYELYQIFEENGPVSYTTVEKAQTFLVEHKNLFPSKNKKDIKKFTDESIGYKHLAKNISRYGDKLMHISYAQVVQIEEIEISVEEMVTSLNMIDESGNQYYIYYIGQLDDVFDDDWVEFYGLPLDMSSFNNTDGGSTPVPVLAGSYISKIEE